VTGRIHNLKEKLFIMDNRTVFLERLFLMRKGYEKHKDRSPGLLYALILDEILSGISVVIDPDDLIAGRVRESVPTQEEENVIRETAAYYNDVCPRAVQAVKPNFEDRAYSGKFSPQSRNAFQVASKPAWFNTFGHVTASWETLLGKGMAGVRETAREKAASVRDSTDSSEAEKRKKLEFLESVIISCNAVIAYAVRYAEAFAGAAENEKDEQRREELRRTGDTLRRVPAYPARSFREALQSVWLLDLIMHQVCGSRDYTPGRTDQYLYDYYRNDVDRGVLTKDEAIELLQNFFIHTVEIGGFTDQANGRANFDYTATTPVRRSLCIDSVQYLVLAGQTPEGADACNELSSVILDAIDELRTKSPAILIRYHEGIDRDFWMKACDVMTRSFNNIGIYNDKPAIEAYVNCGVKPEDAVNYSHYACCNPAIPGKDAQLREDQRNLAKVLEITLNDGFDPVAGVQRGPRTGAVETLESFEQLMSAFKRQLDAEIERAIDRQEAKYEAFVKLTPFSFESCLLEGCVEEATDCNDPKRNPSMGGPGYIHITMICGGLATTADSLAAIKKIVYEEREISLPTLKNVLDSNYEGNERLRQKLLNKYPKFGNDDDTVDSIALDVALAFCEGVRKHGAGRPALGLCWPILYSYHRYRSCGLETGATPDGRRAFEPVSENLSPGNGRDKKSVSALVNSLAKLEPAFRLTPGGGLTVNMHPTAFAVDNGAKVMADLLETYFDKGGLHVQLNVVDRKTLIDAQKHPEKHRDLLVRVTGYSAYFVTLSPECQESIIARYAHSA